MYAWEAIQKALDYIEINIGEEIEMEVLAKEAALSPFYFQRLFSRLVKKPVREYIKLRRLAYAGRMLETGRERIVDIAVACGFKSHGYLSKVFKEAYGMTPEQYRKNPVLLNQFDKPDLLLNYTMIDEGVPLISEGIVIEMNLVLLTAPILFMGVTGVIPIEGQMPLGEATGIDLPGEVWKRFHQQKHQIPKIPGGREVGVAYLGDAPEGYFIYFTGAEVEAGEKSPSFTSWQLPPREYMVCGFEGENFEQLVTVVLNKAVKFSQLWLDTHRMTMEAYSPEIYYENTPEAFYMELWMPYKKLENQS